MRLTNPGPNSHGYVKYAVRFFPGLPIGTGIDNSAYIYFDFNPPIHTNTVTTLIAYPPVNVGVTEIPNTINVLVFPNPVQDVLQGVINGNNATDGFALELVDLTGAVVFHSAFYGNTFAVNVSQFPNGLYFGRIKNSDLKGRSVHFRFIVLR